MTIGGVGNFPLKPQSWLAFVSLSSFVSVSDTGMFARMCQALVEPEVKVSFRAVSTLRPASLPDRKVPRDDAFFRYRPSYPVEG